MKGILHVKKGDVAIVVESFEYVDRNFEPVKVMPGDRIIFVNTVHNRLNYIWVAQSAGRIYINRPKIFVIQKSMTKLKKKLEVEIYGIRDNCKEYRL